MNVEDQLKTFVILNDLRFYLDKITLPQATKLARADEIPGTLKGLKEMISEERERSCVYWGHRMKPQMRDKVASDKYWNELRATVVRYAEVMHDLPIDQAEKVIRISMPTNFTLMLGLTSKYRVWK